MLLITNSWNWVCNNWC